MKIDGTSYRTIWVAENNETVQIIDQTRLPFAFVIVDLDRVEDAAHAIRSMQVRGAPLIGVTAAYGMALAMRENPSDENLQAAYRLLLATRPTAVNLRWALDDLLDLLVPLSASLRCEVAYRRASEIMEADVETCRLIGEHGLPLMEDIAARKEGPVNILTHCNAGWLATVDWGTAISPIYHAFNKGIDVHVWVDETRPRNQGGFLTAYELGHHGVPHTVIVDNVGGHLMQHGQVDMVITGTDSTSYTGDVCNKIGTYLKALAAHDNGVPFYVALPGSTIDWTLRDGVRDIPIEQREDEEVSMITGMTEEGIMTPVSIITENSPVANYAFDVTPARLVTGLITERGISAASECFGKINFLLDCRAGTPHLKIAHRSAAAC